MEKTLTRAERVLAGVVLTVLTLFFCSIALRAFTRLVLVKKLWMDNAFTRTVLFDAPGMKDTSVEIDWQTLYPFPIQSTKTPKVNKIVAITKKYSSKLDSLKERIDDYVSKNLMGYYSFLETAKRYENTVEWNFTAMSEYNGVIKLADGYLTGLVEKRDVSESANSVILLADFCRQEGLNFLYVNAPYKICRFEDADLSGTVDFSNQNADEFLQMLAEVGVKYYDLREVLHMEGMSHHGAFFRTDHHWLPETGLWASKHILQILRNEYGYSVDPSVLDKDKFTAVNYPSWFLGSQGKKVTLARTQPEDIVLFYPQYTTFLHYQIPSLGMDVRGDFSVTYDMSQVTERDYYHKNPYGVYNYGDRPLIEIKNELITQNFKLLIIKDSFADCVIPFLALGIKNVYALDIRSFTGSVQSYIKYTRPDIVIVLYQLEALGKPIDWESHKGKYDFR